MTYGKKKTNGDVSDMRSEGTCVDMWDNNITKEKIEKFWEDEFWEEGSDIEAQIDPWEDPWGDPGPDSEFEVEHNRKGAVEEYIEYSKIMRSISCEELAKLMENDFAKYITYNKLVKSATEVLDGTAELRDFGNLARRLLKSKNNEENFPF